MEANRLASDEWITNDRGQSPRASYAEADQGTLLGLYHGYDQARIALAKLVARYGTEARSDEDTRRLLCEWVSDAYRIEARRLGPRRRLMRP